MEFDETPKSEIFKMENLTNDPKHLTVTDFRLRGASTALREPIQSEKVVFKLLLTLVLLNRLQSLMQSPSVLHQGTAWMCQTQEALELSKMAPRSLQQLCSCCIERETTTCRRASKQHGTYDSHHGDAPSFVSRLPS